MAVNNANLHKLPLKSTINLNRFETEINDWKQYLKLNSPMYGGVLSNFYEKGDLLEEGHKFIMYDKYNNLWTKKYNSSSTNTEVYRNGIFVKSFTNESAEKVKLQEDYNIIAGNEDFPIYQDDYSGMNVTSEFVYSSDSTYGLMIVQSWEETSLERTIEIFDISSGTKELVHSFTMTIDSTTENTEFFTSSAITVSSDVVLLHFSLLPYGKIDWEEYFKNESYRCFNMSDYSEVTLSFTNGPKAIPVPAKDYEVKKDIWDGTYALGYFPYGEIYGDNGTVYSRNDETGITSDTYSELRSELRKNSQGFILERVAFNIENSIIFDNNLYIFPYSYDDITNPFGLDVFEGQYIYSISLDTFESATISESVVTNSNEFTLHSLFSFENYISLQDDVELYNSDNTYTDVFKIDYITVYSTPAETHYVTPSYIKGMLKLELTKLNITFDFRNCFNMEIQNEYSPFIRGVAVGTKTPDQAVSESGLNSVLSDTLVFDLRLDIDPSLSYKGADLRGWMTWDIYTSTYTNAISADEIVDGTYYYKDPEGDGYKVTSVKDKCMFYSSHIREKARSESIAIKLYNAYYDTWEWVDEYNYTFNRAVYSTVAIPQNYKLQGDKLGYTFTNGEPFAITRGIFNLENQITKFVSFDTTNNIVYYKDNQKNYCCIKAIDMTDCVSHQVVDNFIIMNSVNYTDGDKTNCIDTEDLTFFPSSLDWNSRNSLLFDTDCGLEFEDNIVCGFYCGILVHQREQAETGFEESVQAILFVSSVNAQFLSADNGVGENWCSSLVGVQALESVPSAYLGDDTMNNNGYFGFGNENVTYLTDDVSDYATFHIDNYLSNIMSTSEIEDVTDYPTACLYRFSMPTANQDLADLVGSISYPFESNVLLNICLFDEIFSSYYTEWFVKVNKNVYNLIYNGTTLEPVFAYEMLTQGTFEGAFVINGSIYGYNDKYIFPISYNNGVLTQGQAIINIKGLEYIESTPYQAFFYSPSNRSIYSFAGDNSINKVFESNRITEITKAFYNTATQDIWCVTNDGVMCIQIDNTMIKLETTDYIDIGLVNDKIYLVGTDNEDLKLLSYNYDEDYDKVPIELETEYYGVDDFTVSVNDCVYIRLSTDDERNDYVGDVTLSCKTLTQLSKQSETKVFHIEKSDWDTETNTILLRYQPQYQEGIGFGISVISDFPISSIYINSTPIAITNSKNNI